MKGSVAKCLEDLVCEKFGKDKWNNILKGLGLSDETTFRPTQDVDDQAILKAIDLTCKELNITFQQAADAFGDYWVNVYAPKVYSIYYKGMNSAREFILKMDNVHETATRNIPNAHPPRFEYEWKDDKTLIIKYISKRNLIDIYIGLIKGIGKKFNETISISKIDSSKVKLVFSK